ncbi:hypothetical protein SAY87_006334 [Trapa incisa]|uniref:Uncharacterized protein n=1 Tax=Trapa incisa TaxID=236973 RepID=A0AAN7JZM1_9MYRT|nr:hypothetical protein SAY87_006334 [Trapa incisa]
MTVDDSFKKPGAVPFKWEIRPGVPRTQPDHHYHCHGRHVSKECQPPTPPKLKPPSSQSPRFPQEVPRNRSFRSAPRARPERRKADLPVSQGCFPASPMLRLKKENSSSRVAAYESGLKQKSTGRSTPARKTASSPFRISPSSSVQSSSPKLSISSPRLSVSSYPFSPPQPWEDPHWGAGYWLF